MQKKPVFHLFIPCLLKPLKEWYQDFLFEVNTPYLSALLTQYVSINNNKLSLDEAIFHTLNSEVKELPVAYYRHQIQIGEQLNGLICADPVYLEVGMNDVTLTNKITDLSNDEAKELIDILNAHFTQDGLQFIFGSNQCWYVSYPENEIIRSHDLDSALSKNVTNKRIQSEQRNWQIIQNETQMLLHNSEINQQREIAGLKPVNSLWFWGAGKPLDRCVEFERIYYINKKSAKLRGKFLAKAANCEPEVLPSEISSLLDHLKHNNKDSNHMLILDQLFMPALENNLDGFQQQLEQMDNNIIKPLLNAWKDNQIDIIINDCNGMSINPQKEPVWKFWTKPKILREIMG